MRITKEEIVAGHSSLQVRGFLRKFDVGFFTRPAVERFMRLQPEQAEKFIKDMVALELIEPTTPFDNEAAFEVAERGVRFANATAARPIRRQTAERILREFMSRVNAVNNSKEYAFRVKSAILFGSMLSSANRLGDVDIAVDLQPCTSAPVQFRKLCDRRRRLAQRRGRSLSGAIDWVLWPKKEVIRQLKARSRSLSLHGFDQFMQMENFCYRVLIGDANLIAAEFPIGTAA